jgi:hypothetical protein
MCNTTCNQRPFQVGDKVRRNGRFYADCAKLACAITEQGKIYEIIDVSNNYEVQVNDEMQSILYQVWLELVEPAPKPPFVPTFRTGHILTISGKNYPYFYKCVKDSYLNKGGEEVNYFDGYWEKLENGSYKWVAWAFESSAVSKFVLADKTEAELNFVPTFRKGDMLLRDYESDDTKPVRQVVRNSFMDDGGEELVEILYLDTNPCDQRSVLPVSMFKKCEFKPTFKKGEWIYCDDRMEQAINNSYLENDKEWVRTILSVGKFHKHYYTRAIVDCRKVTIH